MHYSIHPTIHTVHQVDSSNITEVIETNQLSFLSVYIQVVIVLFCITCSY